MKPISDCFRRLAARIHDWQRDRREAYLASAVDIYDLEWRLREIERTGRHATFH